MPVRWLTVPTPVGYDADRLAAFKRLNEIRLSAGLGMLAGCATAGKGDAASGAGGLDVKKIDRARVLRRADLFLGEKPVTVTAYPVRPGGGSVTTAGVHDFYSEADYSWPDPKDPHAPYVGRDGYSYEGAFFDHRRAMWRFDTIVPTLTAAYVLTHEGKYAAHAREHLRAWFIDEATRMNPSLNYAQAIPNKNVATQYGLIDTLHLLEVARSVVVVWVGSTASSTTRTSRAASSATGSGSRFGYWA